MTLLPLFARLAYPATFGALAIAVAARNTRCETRQALGHPCNRPYAIYKDQQCRRCRLIERRVQAGMRNALRF